MIESLPNIDSIKSELSNANINEVFKQVLAELQATGYGGAKILLKVEPVETPKENDVLKVTQTLINKRIIYFNLFFAF